MNELAGHNLGRYHLEAEIGRGAMGVVYQGKQLVLGRKVAIKVLPRSLAQDTSYVARFTREAKIMAGLNHPNIVQIYDAGRQQQHLYFVMEFIQGPTLANLLYLNGMLPLHLAVEYVAQIADALDAAYQECHVIHRDIKPENLMLNRWGQIKVMDFGLARAPGLQVITTAKTLVGSIYYASPEQVRGIPLDNRSDIYALGVVLYEMVCGQRPFDGYSMIELTQTIVEGNPISPRHVNPNIPPELEVIILKALARDREQRYADADSLAQSLRALTLNPPRSTTVTRNNPTPLPKEQDFHGTATHKSVTRQYPKRPQPRAPITLPSKSEPMLPLHQNQQVTELSSHTHDLQRMAISNQTTYEIPVTRDDREKESRVSENQEMTRRPSMPEKKLWDPFHKRFK